MLPPSTVVTFPVVFSASAWCRKARATSCARTSRPSKLPAIYSLCERPRARPLFDHVVAEQAAANTVGIDGVGANIVASVIERILPHQEQGGGLGQAIGAEFGARIDRLLGGVEQEAAAAPLGAHDPHRMLRHPLIGEKNELETLP